jgi:hypothetical protein
LIILWKDENVAVVVVTALVVVVVAVKGKAIPLQGWTGPEGSNTIGT